jgi:rusticyanin
MAFAIAPQNATSITGMLPPSYSQGYVFVIGGMIDPTLNIQNGASVKFTVVNMANSMYHDFVVSTVAPPYPSTMAQYMIGGGRYGQNMGGMYGVGYESFLYMMSVLSPANYGAGWASTYSYTVTIPNYGSLWYLCTYPGHAEGGMYGRIVTTTGTGTSTSSTSYGASSTLSSASLPSGTISISDATALLRTPLPGANVSQTTNSITFASRNINIVAFAIMPEDATSLTGMQPPSYAKGDVFVIGGLIDPTLYIPKGASVNVTVVNLDNDMYHDFVVSTIAPPYPYMTMQGMMWGSGGFLYMMQVLSPANYASGWAQIYSYNITIPNNNANLWYLCTYPGHAESGMYGEIVTA